MFNRFLLLLGLFVLAACRYESTSDLRSAMTSYTVDAAFAQGEHLFLSRDQNQILLMEITPGRAKIAHQFGGDMPKSEDIIAILGSDRMPKNTYLAMAKGATSAEKGQIYEYYPFYFNKDYIHWIRPSETETVSGLSDLTRRVSEARKKNIGVTFDKIPVGQMRDVANRFIEKRQAREAEAARQKQQREMAESAKSASPPVVSSGGTVKGFTVGDGVYVQGGFSDFAATIQQVDQTSRSVKVRRHDDGISEWVSFDRIISRNQSSANDVARGAAATVLVVCLFNPDACKKQPK